MSKGHPKILRLPRRPSCFSPTAAVVAPGADSRAVETEFSQPNQGVILKVSAQIQGDSFADSLSLVGKDISLIIP